MNLKKMLKTGALCIPLLGVTFLTSCSFLKQAPLTDLEGDLSDKIVLNYNENNNGFEFTNGQFRNLTVEHNKDSYNINVYIIAQDNEKPYFIKTNIKTDDIKQQSYRDMLSTISENIDKFELDYTITPTSEKIISKLNKMTDKNVLTENENDIFSQAYINGYSYEMNGINCTITFDASVRQSRSSYYYKHVNGKNIKKTKTEYEMNNKYSTLQIECKDGNIEEKIYEVLENCESYDSIDSYYVENLYDSFDYATQSNYKVMPYIEGEIEQE